MEKLEQKEKIRKTLLSVYIIILKIAIFQYTYKAVYVYTDAFAG